MYCLVSFNKTMSRPIGTYKNSIVDYADYLATISNRNSKNKARHILAKLWKYNSHTRNLYNAINYFCLELSNSDLRQSAIKTYLLELLKYVLFLDNLILIDALYHLADKHDLDMSDSKLWGKHRPLNPTLPRD